jgi:dual specificity protein kinase YAK1
LVSPDGVQYKIVEYLGQGTFGQVVKCINLKTNSEHAVKIIKNKQEYII